MKRFEKYYHDLYEMIDQTGLKLVEAIERIDNSVTDELDALAWLNDAFYEYEITAKEYETLLNMYHAGYSFIARNGMDIECYKFIEGNDIKKGFVGRFTPQSFGFIKDDEFLEIRKLLEYCDIIDGGQNEKE